MGVIGFLICVTLIKIVWWMGKKLLKRSANFEIMEQVLFHSNVVEKDGDYVYTYLNVFEWKDGRFQIATYYITNLPRNVRFGEVVYKLTNNKGDYGFIGKSVFEREAGKGKLV